jgi:hypothetical protein
MQNSGLARGFDDAKKENEFGYGFEGKVFTVKGFV